MTLWMVPMRPATHWFFLAVWLAVLVLEPRPAWADGGPMGDGCWGCELWLPVGLNLGASSRMTDSGSHGAFLLGGEVSVLDLRESKALHVGGYVDTTYDTEAGLMRSSAGPEFLLLEDSLEVPMGVDVGPMLEWDPHRVNLGGRARLFVPLVFFVPYLGVTLMGTSERSVTVEGGLLLKFPIPLTG